MTGGAAIVLSNKWTDAHRANFKLLHCVRTQYVRYVTLPSTHSFSIIYSSNIESCRIFLNILYYGMICFFIPHSSFPSFTSFFLPTSLLHSICFLTLLISLSVFSVRILSSLLHSFTPSLILPYFFCYVFSEDSFGCVFETEDSENHRGVRLSKGLYFYIMSCYVVCFVVNVMVWYGMLCYVIFVHVNFILFPHSFFFLTFYPFLDPFLLFLFISTLHFLFFPSNALIYTHWYRHSYYQLDPSFINFPLFYFYFARLPSLPHPLPFILPSLSLSVDIVKVAGRAMEKNFTTLGPYVLPLGEQVTYSTIQHGVV
jgi:FAE1/Type III polyketide synthase-like protein